MERLERRREQLGPVNPLAQEEYAEALAHVEELEGQRADLETALRELRALIRETDRQIQETFEQTFAGGGAQLRGARRRRLPRRQRAAAPGRGRAGPAAGARRPAAAGRDAGQRCAIEAAAEAEAERARSAPARRQLPGVEIEITPGGQVDQAPVAALRRREVDDRARVPVRRVPRAPCPFYILDEVEAALDDLNLDRFLALLRRYADRAQFIVITHQKRTMEAADWLYGVSMGEDGVSKVLSRRLPPRSREQAEPRGLRSPRSPRASGAAIVARPVARDWSDLFITG